MFQFTKVALILFSVLALSQTAPVPEPPSEFYEGFNYADSKSHTEQNDRDPVRGQYSFTEPDGSIRTVTYTADGFNGFNVERSAPGVQKVAVAARAPVYSAGPVGVAKVGVPA